MKCEDYEEIYSKTTLEKISDEFSRVRGTAYLDHTGATLYSEVQAKAITEDLCKNIYGNPHALNSSSKLTADIVEQVRERVLSHFHTTSKDYNIIFTSGATASLKLVADTFRWNGAGKFIYLSDNHTSVLGMRELAASKGAEILSLQSDDVENILKDRKFNHFDNETGSCLFVYPAQSNFSGRKYPLTWVRDVQELWEGQHPRSAVMLDAAALVATSPLDLSEVKPDFVPLSFYKMFGLPTGLGALLVRKGSEEMLRKEYFGGGTVLMAISESEARKHVPRDNVHEWFEDGTLPFLSIASLRHGFTTLTRLVPEGMSAVETHTFRLARHLHHGLASLRHYNGNHAAVLYCDNDFEDPKIQGPVVNFNLIRADGSYIGFSEVLHMCNLFNIHLRTGCFCNPGACQGHLQLSLEQLDKHFEAGHVCGDSVDLVAGKPTGSIRASLGYSSVLEDVTQLLDLVRKCFLETSSSSLPPSLSSMTSRATGVPKLVRIFLYPVKSCGAQEVSSWPLGSRGLRGDREWMVATEDGVVLTQKHEPRMCLVKPSLDLEKGALNLSFPGMTDLQISSSNISTTAEDTQSKVCGARVLTGDCGDVAAQWMCEALERSDLRLLRQGSEDSRTQKKGSVGLSLANQAQFLLVGLNSLAWLEEKVMARKQHQEDEEQDNACEGEELLSRFRSNLVISGSKKEFVEKEWKAVKIGSVVLKNEGPCDRCQIICIDQNTGKKTLEPLRTLSAASEGRMQFGTYFSIFQQPEERSLTLYVGSPVTPVTMDN